MTTATKTKSVCVIGAGPAGLTASKTLTHNFPKDAFKVTLMEKSGRIGGLWPSKKPEPDEIYSEYLMSPDMSVNQSRHTVGFSDLAWHETHLQFPKMWQAGQYLERYADVYPGYEICLNSEVVDVHPTNPQDLAATSWVVENKDGVNGDIKKREFDYVIVASGYFGSPRVPETFKHASFHAPIRHSLSVRDLYQLLTDNGKSSLNGGKNIIVVGGQFSGVDIAACMAQQLSSACHSPKDNRLRKFLPDAEEYTIHHLIQRPFWMLPLWVPRDPVLNMGTEQQTANPTPSMVPIDLSGFNSLSFRPPGPMSNNAGSVSVKTARSLNDTLQTMLGNDQSDIGIKGLEVKGDTRSLPCYLGISDNYNEFVRSGLIKIHRGKIPGPAPGDSKSVLVDDKYENRQYRIENVAAIIFATGFDASSSVRFFSEKTWKGISTALQYEPTAHEYPIALNLESTINCNVPTLGFVGFYRSPFWGVMEMQSRFLGKLWLGDEHAKRTLLADDNLEKTVALRDDPRRAQFPMGDYGYSMETLREACGMKRIEPDGNSDARTGVVAPCRYLFDDAPAAQRKEAEKAYAIMNNIFHESETQGKYVRKGIFRGLQGKWKLERELKSTVESYPSGRFKGTATFHPRAPTVEDYDLEYLYIESGDFESEQGLSYNASRRYTYRYDELSDSLSVFFIDLNDPNVTAHFFHSLDLQMPDPSLTAEQKAATGWKAKAHHLCGDDTYDVEYEFKFQGIHIKEWTLGYTVKGPNKDYSISGRYVR